MRSSRDPYLKWRVRIRKLIFYIAIPFPRVNVWRFGLPTGFDSWTKRTFDPSISLWTACGNISFFIDLKIYNGNVLVYISSLTSHSVTIYYLTYSLIFLSHENSIFFSEWKVSSFLYLLKRVCKFHDDW